MPDEQLAQRIEDIAQVELALDPDREALACTLVDHAKHMEHPIIIRAILHKIIGPDMPLVRWLDQYVAWLRTGPPR